MQQPLQPTEQKETVFGFSQKTSARVRLKPIDLMHSKPLIEINGNKKLKAF